MSNGWKWVLAVVGIVGVIWVCNEMADYGAVRQVRESRLRADTTSPVSISVGTVTPTFSYMPRPVGTLTPETTFTDLVVWRFCSGVIAGDLEDRQVGAIYDLDTEALSNDRDWALRVVGLVRREVDTPGFNAEAVAELHDLCLSWRRADWEESKR